MMNLGLESLKVTPQVLTRGKFLSSILTMNLRLESLKVTPWILTKDQDLSSDSNNEPRVRKHQGYPSSLN